MAATKKTSESNTTKTSGLSMSSAGKQSKSISSAKTTVAATSSMDKFKSEVASELGVNLKNGVNGNLSSRESGSIGGEMVRKMIKKQKSRME
jgi:hypothetical protein